MKTIINSPQHTKIRLSELATGEFFSWEFDTDTVYMVLYYSGSYISVFCLTTRSTKLFLDKTVIKLTMDPNQTIKFNL